MATISTTEYLLDQAKRRLTPSFNNFPGMAAVEQQAAEHQLDAARSSRIRRRAAGSSRSWAIVACRSSATSSRCCGADRTICYSCTKPRVRSYSVTHPSCRASRRWVPTQPRSSTPTATRTTPSRAGCR